MKTALLISGLPRFIDQGFPSIRDALIAPNNPDIFIHTWGNPADQALKDKITNLYHPNDLKIDEPKIIHNFHMDLKRMIDKYAPGYGHVKFVEMVYSMWWSILQANLLKETCRLEHNIKYDCVIRARFDLTYTIPVDVSKFDMNVIHTATRPGLPAEMIDDRFAFSSNSNMNVYCGGFNLIEHIWKKRDKEDGVFCGETICWEMQRIFGIEFRKVPGLAANHLNH